MQRDLCEKRYGIEGEWYTGEKGNSVVNSNMSPKTQPGLWCQWIPNEKGTAIEWDGGEKFYEAEFWIAYLVEGFFKPKGYILNGIVKADGENNDDIWQINITDNVVKRQEGYTEYDEGEVVSLMDKPRPITELKEEVDCEECDMKISCALKTI